MSWGITAVLLLRLDARMGRWEAVSDLAAHLCVPLGEVRSHLEELAAHAMVRVDRNGASGEIVAAMIDPRSVRCA